MLCDVSIIIRLKRAARRQFGTLHLESQPVSVVLHLGLDSTLTVWFDHAFILLGKTTLNK